MSDPWEAAMTATVAVAQGLAYVLVVLTGIGAVIWGSVMWSRWMRRLPTRRAAGASVLLIVGMVWVGVFVSTLFGTPR